MIPWMILHTLRLAAEIKLVSDECQKTESCPGHNDCNYMDHLLHRIFCLPGQIMLQTTVRILFLCSRDIFICGEYK
jgi:hypothetical protein